MTRKLAFVLAACFLLTPPAVFPKWYKGNTHTHTINSDGDTSPDEVVRWYKEHGYNFLVLTDHDFVTDVEGLNSIFAARERFLVIPGEEVSASWTRAEGDNLPVHLNAINLRNTIPPLKAASVAATLQANIDQIKAQGALVQINHPNFHWAFGPKELAEASGYELLEVWNASTNCNDFGGGGRPGTEAIWDSVLSAGKRVFGVASDDAHTFKRFGPRMDNPGQAWVWVRCDSLAAEQIVSALARGDFYFSTGVALREIRVDRKSVTVEIAEPQKGEIKYSVYFIGRWGEILQTSYRNPASYGFQGREGYVRVKVVDSEGQQAWTQPVFLE